MLRNVRNQPNDGGGEPPAAHFARIGESGRMDAADHLPGTAERAVEIRQQFAETGARLHLRGERSQLSFVQPAPFEIGRETIQAARHVADVKTERREAVRPRPDLRGGQPRGVRRQVLARLLKCVKRGREQRIDIRQRAAQPGFRGYFQPILSRRQVMCAR